MIIRDQKEKESLRRGLDCQISEGIHLFLPFVSIDLGDGILHDGIGDILDILLLPVESGPSEEDLRGFAVIAALFHIKMSDLKTIDDLLDRPSVDPHIVLSISDDRLFEGTWNVTGFHLVDEVLDVGSHLACGDPPDGGVLEFLFGVDVFDIDHHV